MHLHVHVYLRCGTERKEGLTQFFGALADVAYLGQLDWVGKWGQNYGIMMNWSDLRKMQEYWLEWDGGHWHIHEIELSDYHIALNS